MNDNEIYEEKHLLNVYRQEKTELAKEHNTYVILE